MAETKTVLTLFVHFAASEFFESEIDAGRSAGTIPEQLPADDSGSLLSYFSDVPFLEALPGPRSALPRGPYNSRPSISARSSGRRSRPRVVHRIDGARRHEGPPMGPSDLRVQSRPTVS